MSGVSRFRLSPEPEHLRMLDWDVRLTVAVWEGNIHVIQTLFHIIKILYRASCKDRNETTPNVQIEVLKNRDSLWVTSYRSLEMEILNKTGDVNPV